MKNTWLKDKDGCNYINYKGYIIWQMGNGDGKWHSGSGHHYITNNLKSNITLAGSPNTKDFELLEPSIAKKKRCALSLKNCKTLIDKYLPNRERA